MLSNSHLLFTPYPPPTYIFFLSFSLSSFPSLSLFLLHNQNHQNFFYKPLLLFLCNKNILIESLDLFINLLLLFFFYSTSMEGHHLQHHQQHQHQQQHHQQHQQRQHQQHAQNIIGTSSANVDVTDRFPQWSIQETKEFLMIRSELDQTFMETKRNKQLWEVISNTMKEKGYHRSAEQCKCKWKNLVTRYKVFLFIYTYIKMNYTINQSLIILCA